MKKRFMIVAMLAVLIVLLAACECEHEWKEASCSAPKTCTLCDATEGEVLPHTWQEVSCAAPKNCSVCGVTEGEALPHTWQEATCAAPKTCSVCGGTEGEALPHTWQEASCTEAKICTVCEEIEGEPLGHTWQDATCSEAKICTVCEETEGEPLGHTWQDATCSEPKTCTVCEETEGEPAPHKWQAATTETPKTCSVCEKTEGTKLQTDPRFTTQATKDLQGTWVSDMVFNNDGLDAFGGLKVRMTLTFGNTGNMTQSTKVVNGEEFKSKMKASLVQELYASLAQEGLSKEQADQAMLATYGMNVNDYAAYMTNATMDPLFNEMAAQAQGVYYVKNGKVYTASNWNASFDEDTFTLQNGQLKIESLISEESGEMLIWRRA